MECEQDVPFSEELLRIANGGTPVILVGKAIVVHDWVDQNTGDGASQMCIFSTNTTVYLGSQEEKRLIVPNPKATGLGGKLSLALMSPKVHPCHHTSAVSLGFAPALLLCSYSGLGLSLAWRQEIFFLAMRLHPNRNRGLDVVA